MSDGFQRGRAASTIFYHPRTHVRVVVHGDNFTFAAKESQLRKIRSKMCEWYEIKVRGTHALEDATCVRWRFGEET